MPPLQLSFAVIDIDNPLLYSAHTHTHTQSETVVEAALGVFAAIASCPGQFRPVLGELLGRFRGDTGTLLLQVSLTMNTDDHAAE